ncbi:hypothetical protein M8C21_005563, partial [Ambrosia artemisiifolia]
MYFPPEDPISQQPTEIKNDKVVGEDDDHKPKRPKDSSETAIKSTRPQG